MTAIKSQRGLPPNGSDIFSSKFHFLSSTSVGKKVLRDHFHAFCFSRLSFIYLLFLLLSTSFLRLLYVRKPTLLSWNKCVCPDWYSGTIKSRLFEKLNELVSSSESHAPELFELSCNWKCTTCFILLLKNGQGINWYISSVDYFNVQYIK